MRPIACSDAGLHVDARPQPHPAPRLPDLCPTSHSISKRPASIPRSTRSSRSPRSASTRPACSTRYHSFVNPGRKLEYRIALLTHIDAGRPRRRAALQQRSPPRSSASSASTRSSARTRRSTRRSSRAKACSSSGRRTTRSSSPACCCPACSSTRSARIADHLGIEFTNRHRAHGRRGRGDARVRGAASAAGDSPPDLLAEADRIASASDWTLRHLFREVAAERPRTPGDSEREGIVHGFVKAPVADRRAGPPSTRRSPSSPTTPSTLIALARRARGAGRVRGPPGADRAWRAPSPRRSPRATS